MKTLIGLLCFVCVFAGSTHAQAYYFSVEDAEYQSIQGGQDLTGTIWNDPQLLVPIGFDFDFYGKSIDELFLPSYFSLVSLLESQEAVASVFIPFGADLIDRGFIEDDHQSTIKSLVTGSPGSRVFTLEYDNAGFYADLFLNGTSTDWVSFQMKLYEANGDIVFHFGPRSVSMPQIAYNGYDGPLIGIAEDFDVANDVVNGEIILLSGDPGDPDLNTDYAEYTLESTIPENTLYRFSKEPISAVDDIAEVRTPYYYPNPASGKIYLDQQRINDVLSPVDVYDTNGRLLKRFEDINACDLSDLPAGLCPLKFQNQNGTFTETIMVIPD